MDKTAINFQMFNPIPLGWGLGGLGVLGGLSHVNPSWTWSPTLCTWSPPTSQTNQNILMMLSVIKSFSRCNCKYIVTNLSNWVLYLFSIWSSLFNSRKKCALWKRAVLFLLLLTLLFLWFLYWYNGLQVN